VSQDPDETRRWTEALDTEGVSAVRRALERSRAGPPGLIRIGQTWVTQSFAEAWLHCHEPAQDQLEKMEFSARGRCDDHRRRVAAKQELGAQISDYDVFEDGRRPHFQGAGCTA